MSVCCSNMIIITIIRGRALLAAERSGVRRLRARTASSAGAPLARERERYRHRYRYDI